MLAASLAVCVASCMAHLLMALPPVCPAALAGARSATSAASQSPRTWAPPRAAVVARARMWPPSRVRFLAGFIPAGSAQLSNLVHCLAVLRDRTELSALPQLGGLQCCPTHDARPTLDAGSLFLPQATGSAPPAPTSTSSGASSATTAARASPRTSRRSAPPPPALPPQTLACSRARP